MQEAFCPEHMKQDVECVRVDFSCFTLEQDLKSEKLLAINPITPHSWVFSGSSCCWLASNNLIFAGIATLCSAIGQNIDADIPLLVYKALLLTFNSH